MLVTYATCPGAAEVLFFVELLANVSYLCRMKFLLQPGLHVVSKTFDMHASWERLMDLLFDGPLTDLEDDPNDEIITSPTPTPSLHFPGQSTPILPISNPKTKSTNARHRRARARARAEAAATTNRITKGVSSKHKANTTPIILEDFSVADDLYASKPGWTGARQELHSWNNRVVSLDDALKAGCTVFDWDGRCVENSNAVWPC